jgi:hypothetical protein
LCVLSYRARRRDPPVEVSLRGFARLLAACANAALEASARVQVVGYFTKSGTRSVSGTRRTYSKARIKPAVIWVTERWRSQADLDASTEKIRGSDDVAAQ